MKKTLALFDFDGTITKRDTLFEFIRYYHGAARFTFGFLLLSPMLALFKLKLIPNWKAKEYTLRYFFAGQPEQRFNEKCVCFAKDIIPSLIRPLAMEAIQNYKRSGAEVIIVSASPENWVKPWCEFINVTCIATKLEIKDGALTGKLNGKNCYGEVKVERIRQNVTLTEYSEVHTYGDTGGDKPMLALGSKSFYKPFLK